MKILIIEDEKNLAKHIKTGLKDENYAVDWAIDGEIGYEMAGIEEYDCIILDLMLPKIDGLTLLKKLRSDKVSTPILLLTALDSIDKKISGFNEGADDYLIKPFNFDELLVRIKALIRRNHKNIKNNILKIDNLEMDTNAYIVKRNNKEIKLTSKEYSILEYFLLNKGVVLTREKILSHVWDDSYCGFSNIVDVMIKRLRKKIDHDFKNEKPLFITLRGVGYKIG